MNTSVSHTGIHLLNTLTIFAASLDSKTKRSPGPVCSTSSPNNRESARHLHHLFPSPSVSAGASYLKGHFLLVTSKGFTHGLGTSYERCDREGGVDER